MWTSACTALAAALAAVSPVVAALAPVGPERLVNEKAEGFQSDADVAFDAGGGFVVVWSDVGSRVASRRFDAGGQPSGPEFTVAAPENANVESPRVAFQPAGTFVTAYHSSVYDGSAKGVFVRRSDGTGAPIGDSIRASMHVPAGEKAAGVATDGAGNFVVVWDTFDYGQDPSDAGVFAQRYDALGQRLGGEFKVNSYEPGDQRYPVVAADAAGGFVVAWQSGPTSSESNAQDGDGAGIFARRYDAAGSALSGEFQVNTQTAGYQLSPVLASAPDGGVVVAWMSSAPDESDDEDGVFFQSFHPDGTRAGVETQAKKTTTQSQSQPSVAVDATGSFVLAWTAGDDSDGDAIGIFARHFARNGVPLGGAFQVNQWTEGYQYAPDVAAGRAGEFVVAWSSGFYRGADGPDGDDASVAVRRLTTVRAGTALVLRARKLRLDSLDPAIAADHGAAGDDADPTIVGGSLRLRSETFDVTYPLAADGWHSLGENRGWEYRAAAGAIRKLRVRFGKSMAVRGNGDALQYDLADDPGTVDATVAVGAGGPRWCARFAGARVFHAGKVLKAKGAPQYSGCS